MFEIPGTNIRKVHITEEVVMGRNKPGYEDGSGMSDSTSSSSYDNVQDIDDKERAVNP